MHFSVLPLSVRQDHNLSYGAKFLYGEITAMMGRDGCKDNTEDFAEAINDTPDNVVAFLYELIVNGHLVAKGGRLYVPDQKAEVKRVRSVFTPPTKAQVEEYFREIGVGHMASVLSEKFIDYYTIRGWRPKGSTTQMKDWKAACRTFKRNMKAFNEGNSDVRVIARGSTTPIFISRELWERSQKSGNNFYRLYEGN